MNTQRLAAVRLDNKVLSNVWWPLLLFDENDQMEKALVLWLNSTLGLVILLAHRQEVQGSWVAFQKPILNKLPVLEISALPAEKIRALASTYDLLSLDTMLPFPNLAHDVTRQRIDEAIVEALEFPDIGILRDLLSHEPIVCFRPLYQVI
jgi:hypothetical protein